MITGITAIAVWQADSTITCAAYTDEGASALPGITDEEAHLLARMVHEAILNGYGSVRPFLCEGTVGWYWEA